MTLDWQHLAGEVTLRPGPGTHDTLVSTRPDLAPRLASGRPADRLPDLLGTLFALCSHAHRWTARRAVERALGRPDRVSPADRQAHRRATLREHLLRLGHDWPRLVPWPGTPASPSAHEALRDCPAWRDGAGADEDLSALRDWLDRQWLGRRPAAWLAAFEADPQAWPARWCMDAPGPVAAWLRAQRAQAQALDAPGPALRLEGDAAMAELARCMVDQPDFCARPHWQGRQPDTGPWSRAVDGGPGGASAAHTAWDRLIARLVELLRLAEPGGEQWLAHGALALGPGEGLAWTEMARGLLVHRVRLADGAGGEPVVADCRVLAPTEWNFHSAGVLAQALRRLPDDAAQSGGAALLAVAFDPCVPFRIAGTVAKAQDGGIALESGSCTS